jgi:hypothetical protein
MPIDNEKTFVKRTHGRRKFRRGKPVEWFEKYRGEGIAAVHAAMLEDRLR